MNLRIKTIQLDNIEKGKLVPYKVPYESNTLATRLKCFMRMNPIIERLIESYYGIMYLP